MPATDNFSGVCLGALLTDVLIPSDLKSMVVRGLQLDSRQVSVGDVFIAVPGLNTDGRKFIHQVLAAGAVAVLAEADGLNVQDHRVIPVAQLTSRLSAIAGTFYGEPSSVLNVTGITGTNGKTTCSYLLGQLLSRLNGQTAFLGTLGFGLFSAGEPTDVGLQNFGLTTPDAIVTQALLAKSKDNQAKNVVMEVSSHSLDQYRVAGVQFDTAIFTNVSRDHLDYHQTMENYTAAKLQLFRQVGLRCAIVNNDDPVSRKIIDLVAPEVHVISYALNAKADVTITQLSTTNAGFSGFVHTPWGRGELRSNLVGDFNVLNLLAVISAAGSQGYSLSAILAEISKLQPAIGRMQVVTKIGEQAPQVIVDYAHTPDALSSALKTLRVSCKGRLWVVFGCGGERDKGKRGQMGSIANSFADKVILTSDNPRNENPQSILSEIAQYMQGATVIENREAAITLAISKADANDSILIAGKGHEEYQQIGSDKLPFSDTECARKALNTVWGRSVEH